MRSLADVRRVMRAMLLTPGSHGWGVVIEWVGGPGGGKTSLPPAVARELALAYEWLSPVQRGEGAFGVVPVPEGAGDDMVLRFPRADWAVALDGAGLVLVDELTCAPPALQGALLGLLLDRRIGSCQLPPGVRLMAAANPVDSAAAGWDLPAATANRLVHLSWPDPQVDEWGGWLATVAQADVARLAPSPTPAFLAGDELAEAREARVAEEARVLAGWGLAWARACGLVGGYLRGKPESLRREPRAGTPEASGAWPSPRSWETATRCVAGAIIHQLDDVLRDELVEGCVGHGVAHEWASWAAAADLPDLAALADGQLAWTPDGTRLDRTCAVAAGLGALLKGDSDRKRARARARVAFRVLSTVEDVDLLRPLCDAAALDLGGSRLSQDAYRVYQRLESINGGIDPKTPRPGEVA